MTGKFVCQEDLQMHGFPDHMLHYATRASAKVVKESKLLVMHLDKGHQQNAADRHKQKLILKEEIPARNKGSAIRGT